MRDERDPLDDLKGLWDQLGDEAPVHPEASELDGEILSWMQGAWESVEVPEAPGLPRRSSWNWRRWGAVAAALLVAFLVREGVRSETSDPGTETPPPRTAITSNDQVATPGSNTGAPVAPILRPTPRSDGWELRSGPVKLVMVMPVEDGPQ